MTDLPNLVTGPWRLADVSSGLLGTPKHGLTVFSCFHCGGGSTMGYKLAGFDVLGGVEIDPEMMAMYRRNHHPRHSYLMGVQEFKRLNDAELPRALFELDVLDGSPPCSSFSMAGSREDAWGKSKKFREGQTDQVLDDLFFDFIDIAKKLQPRVVLAENVKGLIQGNARGYVQEIFKQFELAGYDAQLFLMDASRMGVPQARERTFFIARRRGAGLPKLSPSFNEPIIGAGRAMERLPELLVNARADRDLPKSIRSLWSKGAPGKSLSEAGEGSFFSWRKLHPDLPSSTVTATHCMLHWREPRFVSSKEVIRLQSFPDDYDFCGSAVPYVCGMSVPPLMMQRVASAIARTLLQADGRSADRPR